MDRETLLTMFKDAPGISGDEKKGFEVEEKHKVSLFVGRPGEGLVVQNVRSLSFRDRFLRVESTDPESTSLFAYELIQGLAIRHTEAKRDRRAGFV